jgi:hypothetical protein
MSEVEKPWIAFKILAAGAIPPASGFRYAPRVAPTSSVSACSIRVEANAALTRTLLADPAIENRPRAWMA